MLINMKNNIQAVVLNREVVLTLTLVGVATLAPLLHSQLVTGTIVNAALFCAVIFAGFRAAAAVALIPSLIALTAGTLPLAMAAMVPYIMASNIALAGIFALLRRANYWLAAGAASLAKFVMLAVAASAILTAVTHGSISLALASMMGWPQLITAMLGAGLVWALFERKQVKKA
jgi:hypothetical protein